MKRGCFTEYVLALYEAGLVSWTEYCETIAKPRFCDVEVEQMTSNTSRFDVKTLEYVRRVLRNGVRYYDDISKQSAITGNTYDAKTFRQKCSTTQDVIDFLDLLIREQQEA